MISSLKQPAASLSSSILHSSDFLGSRPKFAAVQCPPSLGPARPLRSSVVSLSKQLHISSFERKRRSPITCVAFEADRSEDAAAVPSEAKRKAKIGIYFATWWGLNVVFNIYNKKVLNVYPYPWLKVKRI